MHVLCLRVLAAGLVGVVAAVASGCDDEVVLSVPRVDAAPPDAGATLDARADAEEARDATVAATPARLLVTGVDFVGARSELLALNLETRAVDGRIAFASSATTVVPASGALFVVARDTSTVTRLEPGGPWQTIATWRLDDGEARAGFAARADVIAVGAKAYVVFADRNAVAVLDLASRGDGGRATSSIDLARLVQVGDSDGVVDVVAGVYVPSRRLVYLVLGNVDTRASSDGRSPCSGAKATVVAIDVDTQSLVDLNGGGPGIALELAGVGPVAVAYDAPRDRLLVAHAGCVPRGDAGLSAPDGAAPSTATLGRQLEELSLFTNESRSLLNMPLLGAPTRFTLVDDHRAFVELTSDDGGRATYTWDPSSRALGRAIPAPDAFSFDGEGRLLGVERQFAHDGGDDAYDAVTVRIADGRKSTIATLPFALREPFVQSTTLVRP